MIVTLANRWEVIQASGISKEFPTCEVEGIHVYEPEAVEKCLGRANYELLLNDLIDYEDAVPFDSQGTYAMGDVVVENGFLYESLVNVNESPISDHTAWKRAPKFSTACFNELWCGYLLGYIARSVVVNILEPNAVYFSASGLVERMGDNFKPANEKKILMLQKRLNSQIESFYNQMIKYLQRTKCLQLPGGKGCQDGSGRCNKTRGKWRIA